MARPAPRTIGGIISVAAATLLYGFNWPLAEQGRFVEPVVRLYLQTEQVRAASASFGDAPAGLSRDQLAALAEATAAGRRVTISTIAVRGSMMRAVARVEFDVNGASPADGRRVRYLLLGQGGPGGWMVERGTTAFTYYFLF